MVAYKRDNNYTSSFDPAKEVQALVAYKCEYNDVEITSYSIQGLLKV